MLKLTIVFASLLAVSGAGRPNKYDRLKEVFEIIRGNQTLLRLWEEHEAKHIAAQINYNRTQRWTKFPCDLSASSSSSATSVHTLEPKDVSVIAALGDSLTAGNGILAVSFLDCLMEYRGRAWSIGGDLNLEQGVETLPNVLRKYNPSLRGFSQGRCSVENEGCSQLNVANPGDVASNMPGQAQLLVNRLRSRTDIDFNNDWKVITLFVGGNDLCDLCHNPAAYTPQSYINNIRSALDILHANVPRAFVNLVEIFDITPLGKLSKGFICNFITNMVCDCARNAANDAMLQTAAAGFQQETEALVASGRYDTRDDFTVVLQPFFKYTEPPKDQSGENDLAYFAPDCFHFSELGTNAAGRSLWNNMLEPVGLKQNHWHLNEPFHCPSTAGNQHAYLATAKNSGL